MSTNYNSTLQSNNTDLQAILDTINELPNAGGSEPVLQDKTVTPTTSQQTITADSGYDGLDTVTVNAMPTATQATPSITVNSEGLITATATQTAGYVAAGTKSATKQLTTQAAKTITPSAVQQTAVASGRYTTGTITVAKIPDTYVQPKVTKAATTYTPTTSDQTISSGTYITGTQTIKGDSNLVAENIAEGVSIFGVTGTHSGGSSGGGADIETCTVTIDTTYPNSNVYGVVFATELVDGNITTLMCDLASCSLPSSFNNIVKNTPFFIAEVGGFGNWSASDNLTLIYIHNNFVFSVDGDGTIMANPCFVYNTRILLADRTTKLVQDITYRDNLLVWDFDNGCYASAKPIWIKKSQTTDYYYLCKFENGIELKLVGSDGKCHRILDIENGTFESATDCVGKRVMTEQGETILLSCERVEEEIEFYNIITYKHINLYAEGVLASCRLNNIYPIENMKFVKDKRTQNLREDYPEIGSDMFRGLRIAEQPMTKEEIDVYVNRLYAFMDWKPRYLVDDHTGTGNVVELTEAEYLAVTGTEETRSYASKVYHNELAIEEVPEGLREQVQTVVNNKIARWGEYHASEIPATELKTMIEEVV